MGVVHTRSALPALERLYLALARRSNLAAPLWGNLKNGRHDYFLSAAPDAVDAATRLHRPRRTRRLPCLLVPRRSRDRHQPAPRLGPVPVHEADPLPGRLFDFAPRKGPPPRQLSPTPEGGWSPAQGRPLARLHHHPARDADGSHLKVRAHRP